MPPPPAPWLELNCLMEGFACYRADKESVFSLLEAFLWFVKEITAAVLHIFSSAASSALFIFERRRNRYILMVPARPHFLASQKWIWSERCQELKQSLHESTKSLCAAAARQSVGCWHYWLEVSLSGPLAVGGGGLQPAKTPSQGGERGRDGVEKRANEEGGDRRGRKLKNKPREATAVSEEESLSC